MFEFAMDFVLDYLKARFKDSAITISLLGGITMKGKVFVVLALFLALNFAMTPIAHAKYVRLTCTIDSVETDAFGAVLITFTINTAAGPRTRTHYAPAGQEKTMLAVALTAMTSGLQVQAFIDFYNPGEQNPIGYLRLNKTS